MILRRKYLQEKRLCHSKACKKEGKTSDMRFATKRLLFISFVHKM